MANADRIIEILHEAKARPAGTGRERFLAEACGDDAALMEQLVSLLRADANEGDSDFLKVTRIIRPPIPITEKPGDRIGRYKLLEQIGEGGCGVVYMAEQEEPVRRRVALKVIKLGMDTKQVIARFEAERQALAMMDHPNIAKVLDGGATETGRPFFVMELVRGIKITDYCDHNNLSTKERLELFMQVCQAIQHAHQKGIIHRDIKPSNILVTQHDDVAVPKVIDFGIAKATTGQLTDKTVFTAFAQFIGTPAYMSPEQAQMSGLDIDTRADIYSLGVLLYELLTGNTPFDAKELLAAGMDEMRRKIREDEPAKPSTCLSTMQAMDLTTVAKRRHVEPPKLIHLIRGDLDWLVMKCLEKDRTRRYETASALAMDLQRHLDDEPVVARPPSNLYRFQKLVRRNKLAFAAASAVTAALVIGLGISTWMFFKEKQARQRAVAAEQKARSEAAKSQQVAQFLKDMLKGVGPAAALDRNTTMLREILDQTAKRLKDLKAQPAVEADLRVTLGNVYADLGEYTNAAAMHREALALRKKLLGDEHPDVAASLSDLARVLGRQGRLAEAEATCREALAMRRKLFGNEHLAVAGSLLELSTLLRERDPAEAVSTAREALAICRKLLGNEDAGLTYPLHVLAWNVNSQGNSIEAETLSREELAIRKKRFGNEHLDVNSTLSDLATFLQDQHKWAEAEAVIAEALAASRKMLGEENPQVAGSLHQLCYVLGRQSKWPEAEAVAREELKMRRKLLGNDHPDVADTLDLLGHSLTKQGKYTEAETTLREALAIQQKRSGKDNPEMYSQILLCNLLRAQGRLAEVEKLLREILDVIPRDANPSRRREMGLAWLDLARSAFATNQYQIAERASQHAINLFKQLVQENPREPGDPQHLGHSQWQLGEVLLRTGRPDQAERVFLEALQVFEQATRDFPAEPFFRQEQACSQRLLASVVNAAGRIDEAERHYRRAIELYAALAAEFPRNWFYFQEEAYTTWCLADILERAGRIDLAATEYHQATAVYEQASVNFPTNAELKSRLIGSFDYLAAFLKKQGKTNEADEATRKSQAVAKELSGK